MTTETTTQKIAELKADAKLVYNGNLKNLWELAEKYDVTTPSMSYAKQNPSDTYLTIYVQAFGTKNSEKEMQRKLYATIKGQLHELGA